MMNNKMTYIAPELELIEVAENDIIATSTGDSFIGEDDEFEL